MRSIRRWPWFFLALASCTPSPDKSPPAFVAEKPRIERDLAFTTLSKKAYIALQIKTEPIVLKEVQERLTLTGWIMAKPGNEVTLTAPTAGYVRFREGTGVPIAGDRIKPGQELLQIAPVLSPVEQIQVAALKRSIETELIKAQVTLSASESDLARIRELHSQNLRSKQDLELAQKARDHAVEELAGAKDKLKLFDLPPLPIKASQGGNILSAPISAGQYVPASGPLVTLIELNPTWIRVPVPEVDLPRIDVKQPIAIHVAEGDAKRDARATFLSARPAGRVAHVDPIRHTAELWYEIEKVPEGKSFVKDQMLPVHFTLGKVEKATVVPYSAIVFDAQGHAWIYLERTAGGDAQHRFERQPVEMGGVSGDGIIIRTNLSSGDRVVTNGAAVLFSRDFHKTPVQEDD